MGQAIVINRRRESNIVAAREKKRRANKMDIDSNTGSDYDEDGEPRKRCTRAKCKSCCKSFTAFLFSTLGLVIMVAAYSAAGGFIFQLLEEEEETIRTLIGRTVAENATEDVLQELWELTKEVNIFEVSNWTERARILLIVYKSNLHHATTLNSWDGKEVHEIIETKWNFPGALLYAVTAITTIGYGHVTPKTWQGQMITIVYCLFGLPLTLMCIANVGKFFARVFRILYHTLFCGICCICCLEYRKKKLRQKMQSEHSGSNIALELLGNGTSPLTVTNDPKKDKKVSNLSKAQVWLMNVKNKFQHSMRDDVTVPIYLCLVVMAMYIGVGALMFSIWEKWEAHTGAYFCFVTLTTIGFGDFVPGIDGNQTERLVCVALYVFIGLALIGMCIDLMQADVIQKCVWIAKKLGVVSPEKQKLKETKSKASTKSGADPDTDNLPNKAKYESNEAFLDWDNDWQSVNRFEVESKLSTKPKKKKKKSDLEVIIEPPTYQEISETSPEVSSTKIGDLALRISTVDSQHGKLNEYSNEPTRRSGTVDAQRDERQIHAEISPEPRSSQSKSPSPSQKRTRTKNQNNNSREPGINLIKNGSPSVRLLRADKTPMSRLLGEEEADLSDVFDEEDDQTIYNSDGEDVSSLNLNSNNNNNLNNKPRDHVCDSRSPDLQTRHPPMRATKSFHSFWDRNGCPQHELLNRHHSEDVCGSLTGEPLLDLILEDPIYLHNQLRAMTDKHRKTPHLYQNPPNHT